MEDKAKELALTINKLERYYYPFTPTEIGGLFSKYDKIVQEGCSDEEFLHLYEEVKKAWKNKAPVDCIEEESVDLPF